jgi:hypothetical protein
MRRLLDTSQRLRVPRMIYLQLALLPIILISLYGIMVEHEIVDEDALD